MRSVSAHADLADHGEAAVARGVAVAVAEALRIRRTRGAGLRNLAAAGATYLIGAAIGVNTA